MPRTNPHADYRPDCSAILAAVEVLKAQVLAKQCDESWQTTSVVKPVKTKR